MNDGKILSACDAAEILGVHYVTLIRYAEKLGLPKSGRKYIITEAAIAQMEALHNPQCPPGNITIETLAHDTGLKISTLISRAYKHGWVYKKSVGLTPEQAKAICTSLVKGRAPDPGAKYHNWRQLHSRKWKAMREEQKRIS